jgi:hypothetical protein
MDYSRLKDISENAVKHHALVLELKRIVEGCEMFSDEGAPPGVGLLEQELVSVSDQGYAYRCAIGRISVNLPLLFYDAHTHTHTHTHLACSTSLVALHPHILLLLQMLPSHPSYSYSPHLVCHTRRSVSRLLQDPRVRSEDKARLVALFTLKFGGSKAGDLKSKELIDCLAHEQVPMQLRMGVARLREYCGNATSAFKAGKSCDTQRFSSRSSLLPTQHSSSTRSLCHRAHRSRPTRSCILKHHF